MSEARRVLKAEDVMIEKIITNIIYNKDYELTFSFSYKEGTRTLWIRDENSSIERGLAENIIDEIKDLGGEVMHSKSELGKDEYIILFSDSDEENLFLTRLDTVISEHLSESGFTTSKIARQMSMNRQTLSSKIQSCTGLSTLEYLRSKRLKKAIELLALKKYRISEIAYMVGYTSPSYFTRHFRAEFGLKPTDMI